MYHLKEREKADFTETETRMVVARGHVEQMGNVGQRVQIFGHNKNEF